jgi:hypothetical protein
MGATRVGVTGASSASADTAQQYRLAHQRNPDDFVLDGTEKSWCGIIPERPMSIAERLSGNACLVGASGGHWGTFGHEDL